MKERSEQLPDKPFSFSSPLFQFVDSIPFIPEDKRKLLEKRIELAKMVSVIRWLSCFLLSGSVVSLVVLFFTGVKAPFHPAFSFLAIPISVGMLFMGQIIKNRDLT